MLLYLGEGIVTLKDELIMKKNNTHTQRWVFYICCLFLSCQVAVSTVLPARAFQEG